MITYCDVNTCEDCPRYGDDCDGDKKVEHTDYISRADAIEAVCKAVCEDDVSIFPECDQIKYCDEIQALLALPSADAVEVKADQLPPKVPTEWINDGMVLVPQHDWIEMQKKLEEYVSADAVQGDECDHCVYKWGMKGGDDE